MKTALYRLGHTHTHTDACIHTCVLQCARRLIMCAHTAAAYFAKLKKHSVCPGLAHTHTLSHHSANDILSHTCRYDWGSNNLQVQLGSADFPQAYCGFWVFIISINHNIFGYLLNYLLIIWLKCYAESSCSHCGFVAVVYLTLLFEIKKEMEYSFEVSLADKITFNAVIQFFHTYVRVAVQRNTRVVFFVFFFHCITFSMPTNCMIKIPLPSRM